MFCYGPAGTERPSIMPVSHPLPACVFRLSRGGGLQGAESVATKTLSAEVQGAKCC